jgi:hypothetical protein
MLLAMNVLANAVILAGTVWALWTRKVPTRTAGSSVLGFIAICAILNIDAPYACHSRPEVLLNVSFAVAVVWAFWRLEVRDFWSSTHEHP